jgi:FlaG/FlaF family flagellin (archaellin)
MSTVVAKNVQVGTSGTATDNFTIRQPATPDGTVRIANGNSGTTTDLVTVTSAGNLGVGTSSPSNRLSVKQSADNSAAGFGAKIERSANDSVLYLGYRDNTNTWQINATYNSTGAFAPISFHTADAERMRIDTSGNVGIGTSSPQAKLAVSNAGAAGLEFFTNYPGGGVGTYIQSFNRSAVAYSNIAYDAAAHAFFISGTERARIDSSGNLLVGTTSPGSGSSTGLTIASGKYIWNVGAYNFTTASGANLVVQSDGIFQRSSSAAKYKQDVRDLEAVNISNFRPVRYKSNCQGDDQTKEHFGIVADEVAQAGVEELVTRGADGEVEGFQYDRFTVVLLKAIQEQQAIITALTDRITALESN